MVGNNAWREYVQDFLESKFPNLRETGYQITSPDTDVYNCVAWAAGDTERWWWPDALEQDYWPVGVKRERTLAAFTEAFKTLGYRICQDAFLENGFEKIAIYVDENGKPTHTTRQLHNGHWTSKIGSTEDIEHDLEGLTGEEYGSVARIMKRPAG